MKPGEPIVSHGPRSARTLFTIGYEGITQGVLIDRLKHAGVKRLIDVRAVAASRRAGFSKTILRESLQAEGIDYVHLRDLGTPRAGRDAARRGRIEEMRAIFVEHLQEPAAQLQLQHLRDLVKDQSSALLCFETDHTGCHRAILADQLAREDGFAVVAL